VGTGTGIGIGTGVGVGVGVGVLSDMGVNIQSIAVFGGTSIRR